VEMIKITARGFGSLRDRVVFLGGAPPLRDIANLRQMPAGERGEEK
jgi:hypothetical protein